jgi:hypothetical protein
MKPLKKDTLKALKPAGSRGSTFSRTPLFTRWNCVESDEERKPD